ncbi:hypothetical protein [Pasteuria penetrans]|uniref:hypothetical protein n=1 Tax=Pasteuria penetrans TaxID=86005 RepID=UPI000FBB4D9B|nr:hypothetical protein [Pasteuria penetrans]
MFSKGTRIRKTIITFACFSVMMGSFTANVGQVSAAGETMDIGSMTRENHLEDVLSGSERPFTGMSEENPGEKTHKRSKRLVPLLLVGAAVTLWVAGCEGEVEKKNPDGSSVKYHGRGEIQT